MKYRKKPVVIEAFRMGYDDIPDWFKDKQKDRVVTLYCVPFDESRPNNYGQSYCDIETLEGTMRGNYGDYIIKGVNNEIYPCKSDVFVKTYDLVEDESFTYKI